MCVGRRLDRSDSCDPFLPHPQGRAPESLRAAYDEAVGISDRDLEIAREHPRGTERRTLLRYREALNDPDAYARLAAEDRAVIVRWVEIRRLLKERHGLDRDPLNLADPLLSYEALRAAVAAGESRARFGARGGRA